jgi:hypothetical protein
MTVENLTSCQTLFSKLCKADDKTLAMQRMKYLEELGEFFREYLIKCSHEAGLSSMAHRRTCNASIHEEAIDCLIVLTRMKGEVLPCWRQDTRIVQGKESKEYYLFELQSALVEGSLAEIVRNISRLISEDHYHELLMRKLKRWESILIQNGLLYA